MKPRRILFFYRIKPPVERREAKGGGQTGTVTILTPGQRIFLPASLLLDHHKYEVAFKLVTANAL